MSWPPTYTIETRNVDGPWTWQDDVQGWRPAANTAIKVLNLRAKSRIKDRYGIVIAEYPTPQVGRKA